jgi:hypothetical protein
MENLIQTFLRQFHDDHDTPLLLTRREIIEYAADLIENEKIKNHQKQSRKNKKLK